GSRSSKRAGKSFEPTTGTGGTMPRGRMLPRRAKNLIRGVSEIPRPPKDPLPKTAGSVLGVEMIPPALRGNGDGAARCEEEADRRTRNLRWGAAALEYRFSIDGWNAPDFASERSDAAWRRSGGDWEPSGRDGVPISVGWLPTGGGWRPISRRWLPIGRRGPPISFGRLPIGRE